MAPSSSSHLLRSIGVVNSVKLIEEFKKHECLWNTKLPNYPCHSERLLAAENIARTLNIKGFSSKHVLSKIKNLRNSYAQDLKKIENSAEAFARGKIRGLYRPRQPWFPIMDSFLQPHLRPRASTIKEKKTSLIKEQEKPSCEPEAEFDWNVMDNDNTSESSSNDGCSNSGQAKRKRVSVDSDMGNTLSIKEEPCELIDKSTDIEQTDPLQVLQPIVHKDGGHFHDHLVHEKKNVSQVHVQSSSISNQEEKQSNDENQDCFARYIASLLKRLPPHKALEVQPKIVNLIVSHFQDD